MTRSANISTWQNDLNWPKRIINHSFLAQCINHVRFANTLPGEVSHIREQIISYTYNIIYTYNITPAARTYFIFQYFFLFFFFTHFSFTQFYEISSLPTTLNGLFYELKRVLFLILRTRGPFYPALSTITISNTYFF